MEQVHRATDMNPNVVLKRFNPVHVIDGDENGCLTCPNDKPFQVLRGIRNRIEHDDHLTRRDVRCRATEAGLRPVERGSKTFFGNRLQQIIDRADFEGSNGVLIKPCAIAGESDCAFSFFCLEVIDQHSSRGVFARASPLDVVGAAGQLE
jgi:hypothetical protein